MHCHPHGGIGYCDIQYWGLPHPSDWVPSVVYSSDWVPSVVYGGVALPSHAGPPSLWVHYVPTSVRPTGGFPGSSLVSLAHADLRSSSASNVTMSLLVAGPAPHWFPLLQTLHRFLRALLSRHLQ